jgi:hypothetical protein
VGLEILREGFDGRMIFPTGSEQKASLVQIEEEVLIPRLN